MAKKVFKLGKSKELDKHVCGHDNTDKYLKFETYMSAEDLADPNINAMADELIKGYTENYVSDFTDQDIKYVPVIFRVTYRPDQETDFNLIKYNVQGIVDRANQVLSGNYINLGYRQNGNWETPLNSPHHGVECKVRFFLPWKIPKDMVYPFQQVLDKETVNEGLSTGGYIYSSLQKSLDSYGPGVEFIDPQDHEDSLSSYSYQDVKNKRNEVINLSEQNSPDLNQAIADLAAMEEDYFFFLGDTPGLILVPIFLDENGKEDPKGFMYAPPSNVDVGGEEDPDFLSYHIRAIISNQIGEVVEPEYSANLYSTSLNKLIPSSHFLNKIPAISYNAYGHSTSSSNYLGIALLGGLFGRNPSGKSIDLTTMTEHKNGDDLPTFYNSVFLHEFFHTLGYGHHFNGVSLGGTIKTQNYSYLGNKVNPVGNRFTSHRVSFNKFFLPFSPPFKTYDPANENHSLDDLNTLPDFEEIDPNEKLFVEAAIKTLKRATNDFKSPGIAVNIYGSNTNFSSQASFRDVDIYKYSRMFSSIAHLPTFWGGSYTINADGTRSMLINPSTVANVQQTTTTVIPEKTYEIGDVVNNLPATKHMPFKGSGYVYHIDEQNKIAHIVSSSFVNLATYNDWMTMLQKPAGVGGFAEGWELPDLTEVQRVNTNLYSEGLIPTVDSNIGFETAIRNDFDYWTTTVSDKGGNWRLRVNFDLDSPWGLNNDVNDAYIGHQNSGFIIYKHYYGEQTIETTETVETVTRKGPNITIYNPVCDKSDPLKFNWALPFTLDWYNEEYPPFPDNTRVEDMFSPDLCPCLYQEQTATNVIVDLYEEDLSGNFDQNTTTVKVKLFEPLVDEVTGEQITSTTGTIIESPEVAKLSHIYISPKGIAKSLTEANKSKLGVFFNPEGGYAGVRPWDFFGRYDSEGEKSHKRVWLKEIGDIILPNFPVYVGFMPESPLPAAFKFNAAEINTNEFDAGDFTLVNNVNDPSVYNSWGYNFNTITDKYLRIGSSDFNSDNYNPFKLNLEQIGIVEYLQDINEDTFATVSVEDFETFDTARYELPTGSLNFESFYNRQLPNTTNPALDLIGDTLHGPVNQNTFANLMYYNSPKVEPVLPSKETTVRFNYLAYTQEGILSNVIEFGNDMFDVTNQYESIFPDNAQKNSQVNTFQPYLLKMFEFVYSQRIPYLQLQFGCTDPSALNYNENATANDGSCVERVFGCTNPDAANYNLSANVDDGSCEFYSLVPAPTTIIDTCPSEISGACNTYTGSTLLIDYYATASKTGNAGRYTVAPTLDDLVVKRMLNNPEDFYWGQPEKIAIFNKYRYSGGDCPTPLGSESVGALNQGGGCVRVFKLQSCVYPDLFRHNCNVLTDIQFGETGINYSDATDSIKLSNPLEFILYFEALSEDTDITIGTCDLENNESNT